MASLRIVQTFLGTLVLSATLACSGAGLSGSSGSDGKDAGKTGKATAGSDGDNADGGDPGKATSGSASGGASTSGAAGGTGAQATGSAGGSVENATAGATGSADTAPAPPEDLGEPDEQADAATLAIADDEGTVRASKNSGFSMRIAVCKTKRIKAFETGNESWGCEIGCNEDESLVSGGLGFGAAEKNGWSAAPNANGEYACSVNITRCTGGLDLSATGCNTSCYAGCLKRLDQPAEAFAEKKSGLDVRLSKCDTTRVAKNGTAQAWGCDAKCDADETAVSGGGRFGQAYTAGINFKPTDDGYGCVVNITDCSGGLDLDKTGCNSGCDATCAKAIETAAVPFKSRTVTCQTSKQANNGGGNEAWGCVASCDKATEVVASGGWSFGKAFTVGINARPTVNNGFACVANITGCSGGLDLSKTGCDSECYATCLQVEK